LVISKQEAALRKQHACSEVRFRVVVEDGKAQLTAQPVGASKRAWSTVRVRCDASAIERVAALTRWVISRGERERPRKSLGSCRRKMRTENGPDRIGRCDREIPPAMHSIPSAPG